MCIDLYQKSTELLEKLANSIYDRDPQNPNPFFFNMAEIHIVEKWLSEVLNIKHTDDEYDYIKKNMSYLQD
jgi:hypothetical protein